MIFKLIVLTIFTFILASCQLIDNRINGSYSAEELPTGLSLKLTECYLSPPESLPYVCSIVSTPTYASSVDSEKLQASDVPSNISFQLLNNTCIGLSINSSGELEGVISKVSTETCSLTIQAQLGEFVVEETLSLAVTPSLTFLFNAENLFLKKGSASTSLSLLLSSPVPYDTYVEFEILGDQVDILSGVSLITRRIPLLKGQTVVKIDLSVANSVNITEPIYQQIRIKNGSTNPLPRVSVNTYDATVALPVMDKVATGFQHSCGIAAGQLYCWGSNINGQIGNGLSTGGNLESPARIGNSSTWSHIGSGLKHSCGIDGGRLYCWGDDSNGQLGNGAGSSMVYSPEQIGVSSQWAEISTQFYHSCGINNGRLFCWGIDSLGQIGNGSGSSNQIDDPVQIESSNQWSAIAVGNSHSCGIDNGFLFCWGNDVFGQLGNGVGSSQVDSPLQIGLTNGWTNIAIHYQHACAIQSGNLFCWGSNDFGQLGVNATIGSLIESPQQIGVSSEWSKINTGHKNSCGINQGTLFCWGDNFYGQLGLGQGKGGVYNEPQPVVGSGIWSEIATGFTHSCGIRDQQMHCWGSDSYGQIGDGTGSSPVGDPFPLSIGILWAEVSSGSDHSCGLSGGKLYCWGSDRYGQLGNGALSLLDVESPIQIGNSQTWTSIDVNSFHSCGINQGRLFCWGSDTFGRVGNGPTKVSNVEIPSQIGMSSNWTKVSLGAEHTCGIDGGLLYCWGRNILGTLGSTTFGPADVDAPNQVGSSTGWTQISAGGYHSCGIETGNLYCWGADSSGQLGVGLGNSFIEPIPVLVGGSNLWTDISSGATHTCGIDNGFLNCWGSDLNGQLGTLASSNQEEAPVQIEASDQWSTVTTGSSHTCGINQARLYCWGNGSEQQIGNGSDTSNILSPLQIGNSDQWSKISAGASQSCGILSSSLNCWGWTTNIQDGSNSSLLSSPFLLIEWN